MDKIHKHLQTPSDNLDKSTHRSFANRFHTLTTMQTSIEVATTTESSRVANSCRNDSWNYDNLLVGAVQKLLDGQRRRLKVLDRGTWVQAFCKMIQDCDAY